MMFSLNACSPGIDPILGVQLTNDGALRFQVESRPGNKATQYSLYGKSEENKRYSQSWVITKTEPKALLQKVLAFSESAGWRIYREGDQALKKEYLYNARVKVRSGTGEARYGKVHFSLRDLRNVRDGKFLVGFDDENRVMERDQFRELSRADCK